MRRRRASRWLRYGACVTLLLAPALTEARGGYQVEENAVKAAFLYNFVKFVRWPCEEADEGCGEFRIGVLGDDRLGRALDETVAGKTVRGNKIRVLRFQSIRDIEDVHLLFVCFEETDLESILARLEGRAVLTVGETVDFAERGGAIRLYLEEHRMRFEINPGAAKRRGIHVSSELLVLARIVEGGR